MNDALTHALAALNLQPGESQQVRVNGYQVEIRRPLEEESAFTDQAMLQPWTNFADGSHRTRVTVHYEAHPLPVPPPIPSAEEDHT